MSVSIQTEDDYTIFVANLPIVQAINQNSEIDYAEGVKAYFDNMIAGWINNPVEYPEIYNDYMYVASSLHFHHPQRPPAIVSKVNLCWDLH
jgi:hypothetical protein